MPESAHAAVGASRRKHHDFGGSPFTARIDKRQQTGGGEILWEDRAMEALRRPWAAALLLGIASARFFDLGRMAELIFLIWVVTLPLWFVVFKEMVPAVFHRALWHSTSGSSDLVDANTACRWIFSCVIANANSRVRQTGIGTGPQNRPTGASSGLALPRSALQLPPLHSRSLTQSLGPTRSRA